jgi:hypothetical protein
VRTLPRITGLSRRILTVPLLRSWGAEAPENHVIVTEIQTDDGGTGHGFSWTPTIGPQAVKALLDFDVAPFIKGLDANPEGVWDQLWKRLHEAGGGGLTTIAMAPEIAKAYYDAYTSGDEDRRHALLEGFYAPLVRLRDQTPGFGVSLIKAGLRLGGLPVGSVRAPLVDPTGEQLVQLKSILARGYELAGR